MKSCWCSYKKQSHKMMLRSKGILTQLMPTNCSAAKQLPQFCKHSKSADLLRKSLLSHVWRVPSSKALSCKHERLFDLLTLASSSYLFTSSCAAPQAFPPSARYILPHTAPQGLPYAAYLNRIYMQKADKAADSSPTPPDDPPPSGSCT